MAAPNIVNVSLITGNTTAAALTTTTTTTLLSNSNNSNRVFKVNSIYVTNISASSSNVTMEYYNGTTGFKIASVLTVPVGATVILVDKNSPIYLPENSSIRGGAGGSSQLETVISYEDIS